ncbi:MAG: glycosyltransferase family 4 protein [Myxococcota bacterium]
MGVLDHVLFVVWGFPEPTQTFIHRELTEMHRRGERVRLLASHRVAHPGIEPVLAELADNAVYLGPPAQWLRRGLAFAAREPRRFAEAWQYMAGLPHRTTWHRVRALSMVIAAASVAEGVEKAGYRYLHAHFAHHTELVMALSRLTGLPWGATFHAVGIWRERNLLKEKVEESNLIMTCTRHNMDELVRLAPHHASKVQLVHHGIEPSCFNATTPADGALEPVDENRWIAVGRLVEKKGFDVLLRAWAHLHARGRHPRLTIYGEGPERRGLEQLRVELGLEPSVTLAGHVPNREVLAALRCAAGLVQPSVRTPQGDVDGIPNVIIEALAAGRPVVASAISGIPEVVIDGETGLLAPPGDAESLAQALCRVVDDKALRIRLGATGQARIRRDFDLSRNVARQLELLEAAAAS